MRQVAKGIIMSDSSAVYRVGTLVYTRAQLGMLFFWLLWGDFCYMLMETVVPSILPLKFQALGASNASIGLILTTIPMVINTVLNPVISFKSDRYRSRWGRRIPFILFTLPFLVVFLLGVGFGDKIGFWLYPSFSRVTTCLSPNQLSVVVIGIMMAIFSFFNTFVNSVSWYLFNDVVPEHLLARFMSWFRVVSTMAASAYGFFLYEHGATHATEIFIGASILYVMGFGVMCLKVKEGEYPPPPDYVDGETGPLAAIKTYGKECHSLTHYWYVFLVNMCLAGTWAVNPFVLFFSQSIGLNLNMIGKLAGITSITMSVAIVVSGYLADRYHPVRIVIIGFACQVCLVLPAQMIWLFWHPSTQVVFYISIAMAIGLTVPAGALMGVLDPPLFKRIFPRDRYGQFCSANAMWRSISLIINGALAGIFFDVAIKHFGTRIGYCLLPAWQLFFTALALFFLAKLYRSWKQYGGDDAYVPPIPQTENEKAEKQLVAAS